MIRGYTITTWDGSTHYIDNDNGDKLIEAWTGADKPFPVDLGGVAISSSNIKSIIPNEVTEADLPPRRSDTSRQITAGKICRGQYSIQNEINRIAKEEGGTKWAKLITDKKWREQTRVKLRGTGAEWCDYKANECACDVSYISHQATFDRSIA